MKKNLIVLVMLSLLAGAATAEDSISLDVVSSSDFVDLRHNSWVLREAFFGQEYNTDIVDYGSLLSDDCAFATDDNEFDINKKSPYYKEIRHNKRRVYRIQIKLSDGDITYDFNKKGFVFDSDFSIWSNQFYPDEAGKFFFKKGSYIPMPEEKAHALREKIDDFYSDISIVVDIRIHEVSEWTEEKQHSQMGKGLMLMFGANFQDVQKTWQVTHRKVTVEPLRFHIPIDTNEAYTVTILTPTEKRALRKAGGSFAQYNRWANYPGAQLTVDAYVELQHLGVSDDSVYRKMIQSGVSREELATMRKAGGSVPVCIQAKQLGLSVNDYRDIQSHNGSLSGYVNAQDAGCHALDTYIWALEHNIDSSDFHFLCRNDIAPARIDSLLAHGHDISTWRNYYTIRPLSVSAFLRYIVQNDISTETYEKWAPHISATKELTGISAYEYENFKQFHAIAHLSAAEYRELKDDDVSLRTYRTWAPHVRHIEQYILISNHNATLNEYRYFKTFDRDLDYYLTRLAHGWRDSKDYTQYTWDIEHKYVYPHRKTSLYLILGSGTCAGVGFAMHAIADELLKGAQNLHDDYQENPSAENWDAYKKRNNTGHVFLRTGDVSFYTAGGLAILSGIAFFFRKENPHHISTAATDVGMHLESNTEVVKLTVTKKF